MMAFAAIALLLAGFSVGSGVPSIFAQAASDGLRAEIAKVEIPPDRKPVVTFRLTDGSGNPLRLEDMDANSVRFILDRVVTDPETGFPELLSYTVAGVRGRAFTFAGETAEPAASSASQAVYDSGGTFTSLGGGNYTYRFGLTLPFDYDTDAFHRVAMQATRQSRQWVANDTFDFRPNGQVAQDIATVTDAACNSCHDLLTAHGGQRYQMALCATCHTKQTIDPETGRTVDFKVMVHKIHRGENLPTVQAGEPYVIVGFNQSTHDYSEVAFPQDVRNCTTCHNGPQANAYKTRPTAAACGSCHDNVDFTTGAGHAAGPVAAGSCAGCHTPDGPEFGLSVAGAHTIPERSSQLRGVTFNLLGVSNTRPGQQPVIAFQIKDKDGQPIDPSAMSRLAINIAGPTYDYQTVLSASALGNVRVVNPEHYEFTFPQALPADASFVWTAQIEGYINTRLADARGNPVLGANGQPLTVRDAGFDQAIDFAVIENVAWPRKKVVTNENCNQCHGQLSVHGGNRQNVENCVICHNPNATDAAVRPASANPPVTIDFRTMIHKIHSGENLSQQPYIIYGYRGSVNNFGDVLYPTDRRLCGNCHEPMSNWVEFIHEGAVPVTVRSNGAVVSVTPPATATCTSCHDGSTAIAHARAMTAPDGQETCTLCHSSGAQAPVWRNHAVTFPVVDRPQ